MVHSDEGNGDNDDDAMMVRKNDITPLQFDGVCQ